MNTRGATLEASPSNTCHAFVQALNRGDLEGEAACFHRDGCLITPDATAIHGRDRVRPLLAQLIARRTEIEIQLSSAIGAGEAALLRQRWTLRAGAPGESRLVQTVHPTLVLRRVGAAWKLAIVAPWG